MGAGFDALAAALAPHAVGADRCLRETTTTATLRHPHILPRYDSGEAAGALYYVMPLVEGESLRNRDIKPDNILLERGHAIVADWPSRRGLCHVRSRRRRARHGHAADADGMPPPYRFRQEPRYRALLARIRVPERLRR